MPDFVLLENGDKFSGILKGYKGELPVGEAVFNTSMMGYQEILTDPSSVSYTHLTLPTKA